MAIFGAMRKLFVTTILSYCCIFFSNAQNGLPFMTDVPLSRQFSDSRIESMVQDDEETMFFSTSRGLLKFDGSNWERLATPSPAIHVYSHTTSNRMFVGLKKGAVEIHKTDSGTHEVRTIPGLSSRQPVLHILSTTKDVYFIGESEIHQLSALTNEDAIQHEFPEKLISGAFLYNDALYVLFYQEGLFKWSEGNLERVGTNIGIADYQMVFSIETKDGTFVGLDNDQLYRFNGENFNSVNRQVQSFLSNNILSDGILLNDTTFALSTLAGGAVMVHSGREEIQYKFDYTTGTRDNEIFCLGKDSDHGLWLAFESGLSRIDLVQPIKSLSGFPGIEGIITSSLMLDGTLHVGTGNGVFVLKKAASKAEMDRMMLEMVQKRQEARKQQESNFTPPPKAVSKQQNQSNTLLEKFKENPDEVKQELSKKELRELKKELRKQRREERKNKTIGESIEDLFNGNNNDDQSDEKDESSGPAVDEKLIPNPNTGPIGSGMTAPLGSGVSQRSKPAILNSQKDNDKSNSDSQKLKELDNSFIYKKVPGIDVKCRQLIGLNGQIFAATNNGLYIIEGNQSRNLTPGLYINQVESTAGGSLLLATGSGVYKLQKTTTGTWTNIALNDSVKFNAYNVIQDSEGNIWAGTDNGAFRYNSETRFYAIPDVVNERVMVTNAYGKVHFLLPSSLYHFISQTDTVLPASLPEVPTSGRLDYLLGDNGIIWIRSSFGWHVLNGEAYVPMLRYLELFEDIRHISADEEGNLYVIDKGLNVYSILNRSREIEKKFNVYIQQVVDGNGQPFTLERMNIEATANSIAFNISAPFYLKSEATQYQYRVEGLRTTWSRWSSETVINFDFIPAGNYVLQVRAKNVLGDVSEIRTLAFSVQKQIYLRWYALLAYFVLLSLAIFAIIKVRERSLKETQRILEDKVAQRTSDLEKAKVKAEELLLNILPKETADELQKSGKATARHYNQVSVLFTDFKGFTEFAENTKPQELVNELHSYFVKFDEIIGKYHLEKIKTIGDAYMCAGGVPIRNNSNAIATTLAALEIRDYMNEVTARKKKSGDPILEIRIGIHTGPLTAGVVGMKKFAYDIWGDTVNTASRMETASEPGRINVSATTHELIKKYFESESRGKKQVKGKGAIEMYFINSIQSEFSENSDGKTPNKGLWELIS